MLFCSVTCVVAQFFDGRDFTCALCAVQHSRASPYDSNIVTGASFCDANAYESIWGEGMRS